jgi:hypothetical protein
MKPICFASNYAHTKLYRAYDASPIHWKSALFRYSWLRGEGFNLGDKYFDNLKERYEASNYPLDNESCDWWIRKRFKPAFRYVKHASCQFLSYVNLVYAQQYLPGSQWFHIADDDMSDGESHYYVMNEKGHILDAQGLHLDFKIETYQQTFDESKITDENYAYFMMEEMLDDYEVGQISY